MTEHTSLCADSISDDRNQITRWLLDLRPGGADVINNKTVYRFTPRHSLDKPRFEVEGRKSKLGYPEAAAYLARFAK